MMRTRRNSRAAWPLAVAWAFAGALALSLANPSVAAAQSECSPYISGGPNNPMSGTLMGSKHITLTLGADVGAEGKILRGGISGSITESFNVGVYDTGDEHPLEVRCDDYTEWDLQ